MCKVFDDIRQKAFDQGKVEGFNQGRNEGFNQGKDVGFGYTLGQGETQLARLIQILLKNGQMDDISSVISNKDARHAFYKRYGL